MAGLNETPNAERVQIGFFGCRNAGKSSIVNAVTGQALSVVSDVKGTTTDPVKKAMELLPLGPVVIIDTAGLDDEGTLGELRVQKTKQILAQIDIAVLVVDVRRGIRGADKELIAELTARQIPYLIVQNQCDLLETVPQNEGNQIYVSAKTGMNIHALKEQLANLLPESEKKRQLIEDLLHPNDCVVLVCPIDESAPKGRLILPQQQTIRAILDADAVAVVTKETELSAALERLHPALVVTDSQALGTVQNIVPDAVPLTTFSILMARYKGFLETAVQGIAAAKHLHDGSRILVAEGCTHHRQCGDIGTVKIPRLMQKYCGCSLQFEACSGGSFPEDLSDYDMVIHCGGCMNTERDLQYRRNLAAAQGIPFTNYGIALAQMTGTLERTLRCFPQIHMML